MRGASTSAAICLIATLPLFVQPMVLCTLVQCQAMVAAPVAQADVSCCHNADADVASAQAPCHSQSPSPQPNCFLMAAPERFLARPTTATTAPELAPLRIASAIELIELAPLPASATQPSSTLLLKRQFDPIVAKGPRAPPPGDIAPSDWV